MPRAVRAEKSDGAGEMTNKTTQAQPKHRRRRPVEIIDLCSDDEEPLPGKRIKTEPEDDFSSSVTPSIAINQGSDPRMMSTRLESAQRLSAPLNAVDAVIKDGKAKKRARLWLDLEEIRIRRELMALEDDATGSER